MEEAEKWRISGRFLRGEVNLSRIGEMPKRTRAETGIY